mgnify:CR=1 FL=1
MTDWLGALVGSGCLPPRARMHSDVRVLDLAGTWEFSFQPRREDEPGPWGPITVPGCWQQQGHGRPGYLSAQFPFALEVPHVPDDNPIGTYRRWFEVPDGFGRAVLRCDGIDSTGEVTIDGVNLGWTKGSRLTHEFPVSLTPGRHEIVVRVAQFSATSYVEDQDMVRLSGIFRDIAVVARPDGGIDDCVVMADYDPITGRGSLDVRVTSTAEVTVRLDGRPVPLGTTDVGPVDPWSAESPRLYELVVSTASETVTCRVGFRRIEISDGLLRINGSPMRFRGVNRHDTDADHGRTVTRDQVRADLLAMKRAHLNAVRTSHYPPLPYLLDVADEIGLYVLEEGDIETHAFVLDEWRNNPSDDPSWTEAYVDRTARMVRRDRHHASVVMWSLGNEAGAGQNFLEARDWLWREDPTRPIHYERDPSYAPSDVFSVMYPEHDRLERMAAGEEEPADKPILLCEYAHAMGAGPGGLSEYEALFDAHPRLQGGFVWEWRDHTLRLPSGRLAYGGDFGEALHDGAFAADGLHHGDGVPKPGLADLAAVLAPVRLVVADEWDAVTVTHRAEHVDRTSTELFWSVDEDRGQVASGLLEAPPAAPLEVSTVAPPLAPYRRAGRVLTVQARSTRAHAWAGAGHVLGWAQGSALDHGRLPDPVATFDGADFTTLGSLTRLSGVRIDGPELGLWRAPTDNDHGYAMKSRGQLADAQQWSDANLSVLSRRTVSVSTGPGAVEIERWTAPYSRPFGVRSTLRWTPVVGGAALTADLSPEGEWPCDWARCGLDWTIPGLGLQTPLRWEGRGPGRAGVDVGQAARLGWFSGTVADWQVPHARPQDDGLRADVTRLVLGLPDGRDLVVDSEHPLWVSVRPWTDAQLAAAAHPDELPDTGAVVLSLNAAVHGYGTGACGPGVLPAYRLAPGPASFRISITIV